MKDLWPKQAPIQGMAGLWGGIQGSLTAGSGGSVDGVYPSTSFLHLEAQNFTVGSNTWSQSANSNNTQTIAAFGSNTFTKSGSGDTTKIIWPNTGTQYFMVNDLTLPVGIQIICAWQENDPFIIEQSDGSTNANSANGFYFYGNNGSIYGCYRTNWTSGTTSSIRTIDGIGSDWFPGDSVMRVGSMYMSADGNSTGQVRVNNTIHNNVNVGLFPDGGLNVTKDVYIGSRNGNSIFFHGSALSEVWIAPSDGIDTTQFATNVAAMVTKHGL